MRLPEQVEIVIDDAEGDLAMVSIRFWSSRVELTGRMVEDGDVLFVLDAHVQKSGPVRFTPLLLEHLARLLMEELGYVGVHIAGAARTSGARPEVRPRPVRFARRG